MINYRVCILIFFTAIACSQPETADILIDDVNIIDVEKGVIIPNQDVLINGNKVSNISDHKNQANQPIAKTILEGKNKYLIPGLWDMHIHTMRKEWYRWQLPILRANGITGFREMWGDIKIAEYVKSQMEEDSLPFFRFIISGHIVDGKIPFWKGSIAITSADMAQEVVDSLIDDHSDFIKLYSYLQPDIFQAIAKRSRERKIPFSGHVPHLVLLSEASEAGIASTEHLYGFLTEACLNSDSAMSLMRQSVMAFEAGNTKERKRISRLYNNLVLDRFSPEKLKAIAHVLRKNKTHIVPTLAMLRGMYFTSDTSFTNDPRKKYMSKETLDYWSEVTASDLNTNSDEDWGQKRKRWAIEQQIMKILISEKVPIMSGTDSDNPYAFPGFSLHDEMAMYVELGMSSLDALRSATIVPVKFLNMSDSLGNISKGKIADLVLLDANPIDNIKNTTKIRAVVANGNLFDKKYLDYVLHKKQSTR